MSHKQRNRVLVIDGNNLMYRAYYKFSSMKAVSGTPTGITYGFTFILKGLITQLQPQDIYVVFDGGRSKERMAILPGYKDRDKKEGWDANDFYRQKAVTNEILSCLGIKVIEKAKTEADDVIWLLIRKLKRKNHVTLVSSDKDFNQCLSKNVDIWNPGKKCLITEDNVKKLFGYEAKQCVDYLILDGDDSDGIPGMPGVGPKTAIKFLEQYGSIYNFLDDESNTFMKWDRNVLVDKYLDNRQLIDLRLFVRKYLTSKDLVINNKGVTEINEEELQFICGENSIKTFMKPPFIKTFKNLL